MSPPAQDWKNRLAALGDLAEVEVLGRSLPRIEPESEPALLEILRFAEAESLTVLPLGYGSKIGWTRSEGGAHLVLGMNRLRGVLAYEPGDGTITARAGTSLLELSELVARDGFALTPEVSRPASATLGGVVAAGQSGIDRPRTGPVRHHVLGASVALAEGKIVRSGGRLVKNVTGYDLHRLHCGAHGSLGVLTEISLRLLPAPAARRIFELRPLSSGGASLEDLARSAMALRALRLTTLESLQLSEETEPLLTVTLAGLEAQVDEDRSSVVAKFSGCIEVADSEARRIEMRDAWAGESLLHVSLPPSQLADTLGQLGQLAVAEGVEVSFRAEALTAELEVSAGELAPASAAAWIRGCERVLRPVRGARVGARNFPRALRGQVESLTSRPAGVDWMRRLKSALDPNSRFGTGRLWPEP